MPDSIYEIEVTTASGHLERLEAYKGEVLLIVNVASKCGFTPQYTGLEQLHLTYRDRGLRVLGFPCNDFGAQEPGTMEEIEQFCNINYGVTFDLFNKLHCIGEDKHPLYQWLTEQATPSEDVRWNFEKFLVSREGELIQRYSSKVAPEDADLVQAIEKAI